MPCWITEREVYVGKFADTEDSALDRLVLTMRAVPISDSAICVHKAYRIPVPITHGLLGGAWGSAIT